MIGALVLATVCGFAPPVRYAAAAVQSLVVRDLNGDGVPDIIASGNQVDELSAFSVFTNRGDGTFAPERLIASGFGQRVEDVSDLNGDGAPDLLVSDYWSNGIAVYLGPGFESATRYATATHGGPSFIIDVDGDGKPDVVSLSFGSGNPVRLHVFRGNGDGSLAAKTTFDTPLAVGATPSIRVSGGALEILVSEHSQRLGVLRYAGGNVTTTTFSATPGFGIASTFADVNGDGLADIVDTSDEENDWREPVFVSLALPDGTFGERRRLQTFRNVTLPAVVRASGGDLFVSDFQHPDIYWFRGDGAGNFAPGIAIDAGGPVNTFVVADVNRDGRPDLVTANADHTISVIMDIPTCSPRRRSVRH